ncbi:MAG: phosphoribosylformylglycinamidine synthase subunit PurS [archaeon]
MRFKARLVVYLKSGISDPEGDILCARLIRRGFGEISQVRSGKYWEVYLEAASREEALTYLEKVYLGPPVTNPIKDEPKLLALEELE